ncbi:tetratricopeptide repeat protein [Trichlorobacter ammonificans]|uniref:Tetratricopeptide TPR_2 repeat protein n=1 Tax=Trichlorobacter ammonificans TaxID=2916410 RepID=A0ABN8HH59_9BACT|nr:tetratricopeptide repeat protein [Trichlorobacter ammonificans]CAH2032164.1 Tetratricopeptide TPR_2 repeat protein [Trichlorobacter ammonificans]
MASLTDDLQERIRGYRKRLEAAPDSYAFAPLADLYLQAGQGEEALAAARDGVARHPGFLAGRMALARACRQQRLYDEALQALAVVVTATPESLEAQQMRVELSRAAGRHDEALAALRTILEFYPDDLGVRAELAALESSLWDTPPLVDAGGELELIELSDDDVIPEEADESGEETLAVLANAPVVRKTDPWITVDRFAPEPEALFDGIGREAAADDELPLPELAADDDPMITPTVAELYLSQGFGDRAREIYRMLHVRNPEDAAVAARLVELEGMETPDTVEEGAAAGTAAAADRSATNREKVVVLEGWLENIRRVRTCR